MPKHVPEIWIGQDLSDVTREATLRMIDFLQKTLKQKERCSVVLSGGQTPALLYQRLAKHGEIPWHRVDFWFGDERFVSLDHPDSNYKMVKESLFDPLHVSASAIHPIQTQLSLEQAALSYEEELRQIAKEKKGVPLFDLVLLGVGNDGHTASLFPGSVSSWIIPSVGMKWCISITNAPKSPAERISLTPSSLNQSVMMMILVSGKEKAPAVSAALESDADPSEIPIRALFPEHGTMIWLMDRAAAHALTAIP